MTEKTIGSQYRTAIVDGVGVYADKLRAIADFVIVETMGAGYGDSNNTMYILAHPVTRTLIVVEIDYCCGEDSVMVRVPLTMNYGDSKYLVELTGMRNVAGAINNHSIALLEALTLIK